MDNNFLNYPKDDLNNDQLFLLGLFWVSTYLITKNEGYREELWNYITK